MGVQSMDETFKKDSLMRYERSEDIETALNTMRKHGLFAKVDHMFGLPDEPIIAQENARILYAKTHPKRIQTFWTCYLPGTQMMTEAEAKGTITAEQANKINEGEDFYFFRNTENVKDKALMDKYKAYEVIFRLMPALPETWRMNFTLNKVLFIPKFMIRSLSILSDLITGFRQNNPEFSAYALHNIYHLKKFIASKVGVKVNPATPVRENLRFNEKVETPIYRIENSPHAIIHVNEQ
jgi:hypothetical protein